MKPLSHFVSTDFSKLMSEEYGDHLQCIESHIFFNMLRGLNNHNTHEEKISILKRIRSDTGSSSCVHNLAQLGIFMGANDRFHELLKEYDRES